MEVEVEIRSQASPSASANRTIGSLKNVSLAGLYCTVKAPAPFQSGDQVICSLSIPPQHARQFPFTRILGRGWILRLDAVPSGRRAGENQGANALIGVAIAFSPNVTALGTVDN